MEDKDIMTLYAGGNPRAGECAKERYGGYCYALSCNILSNETDAQRCVDEVFVKTEKIDASVRPDRLGIFFGKLTRRLSLDRLSTYSAKKWGAGEIPEVLSELDECILAAEEGQEPSSEEEVTRTVEAFLRGRPVLERQVFLRRYWYVNSVPLVAQQMGLSRSKVETMLSTARKALGEYLKKEGIRL